MVTTVVKFQEYHILDRIDKQEIHLKENKVEVLIHVVYLCKDQNIRRLMM